MAGTQIFGYHRNWEDWLSMALGVVIGLSPWLAGEQGQSAVNWNAVVLGAVVVALGALELSGLQRWEEALEMLSGLWLVASPFVFGYAGTGSLRIWHFVLGAVVVLLAALEQWQDWKLSDKELARHGQQ